MLQTTTTNGILFDTCLFVVLVYSLDIGLWAMQELDFGWFWSDVSYMKKNETHFLWLLEREQDSFTCDLLVVLSKARFYCCSFTLLCSLSEAEKWINQTWYTVSVQPLIIYLHFLMPDVFSIRFIPKSSTVRPITNMKHCPTNKELFGSQKQQSVNRKLQNLFEALKFEKERNPKLLGATLFGCDDLYRVLKPFAERIRRCLSEKPLYFVHVDVNHCYESIPHQKLFDIMKEVLQEEEYLIRRFSLLKLSAGKVFRWAVFTLILRW